MYLNVYKPFKNKMKKKNWFADMFAFTFQSNIFAQLQTSTICKNNFLIRLAHTRILKLNSLWRQWKACPHKKVQNVCIKLMGKSFHVTAMIKKKTKSCKKYCKKLFVVEKHHSLGYHGSPQSVCIVSPSWLVSVSIGWVVSESPGPLGLELPSVSGVVVSAGDGEAGLGGGGRDLVMIGLQNLTQYQKHDVVH